MDKNDLIFADTKKRLVMMPRGLMESIIIINKNATKSSFDSARRWVNMITDTLNELEEITHGDGN